MSHLSHAISCLATAHSLDCACLPGWNIHNNLESATPWQISTINCYAPPHAHTPLLPRPLLPENNSLALALCPIGAPGPIGFIVFGPNTLILCYFQLNCMTAVPPFFANPSIVSPPACYNNMLPHRKQLSSPDVPSSWRLWSD